MTADELFAEALALKELGASVVDATDIGTFAVEYAVNQWEVFPLRGKVPAIAGGRGVLDATTNVATVAAWWGGRYRGCNIGAKVPEGMVVIDVDPRHGGQDSLDALEAAHCKLPETLTTISGRGDGGRHLFYRRPAGKLSGTRLGPGIDLKTSSGYVVMPPSLHPESGQPYTRLEADVAAPPGWLVALLHPEPAAPIFHQPRRFQSIHGRSSVADDYSRETSWTDVLAPHGWRCLDADPDADGARWRHPNATSAHSATIRHSYLFVYSPNTAFEVTEPEQPKGYSRFRAFAVLNHSGDMKAAARSLTADLKVPSP